MKREDEDCSSLWKSMQWIEPRVSEGVRMKVNVQVNDESFLVAQLVTMRLSHGPVER